MNRGLSLAVIGAMIGATTAVVAPRPATAVMPAGKWIQQSPPDSPAVRERAAMGYDADNGTVVLFGGIGVGGVATNGNTWTWDGLTWSRMHPATSPPPRQYAAMTYDAATKSMVLFGGDNGSAVIGDTWTWDGVTWTEIHPLTSPSARRATSLTYDPASGSAVLFGGDTGGAVVGDTWAWNGSTWIQRFPAMSPSPREGSSMVYDEATATTVLFGGVAAGIMGDTWIWNGSAWAQRTPLASPSGRAFASMAYDRVTAAPVLFGGDGAAGSEVGDTWTWDGSTWTIQPSSASPSPRDNASMAYDVATAMIVLFGGAQANVPLGDTWLWGPSTASATTTVLRSSTNPSGAGQPVSFTALVGPVPDGGTVQFSIDGSPLGSPVPVSPVNGAATSSSSSSLAPGTHQIGATYSGNNDFPTSTATPLIQSVKSANASLAGVVGGDDALYVKPAGGQFKSLGGILLAAPAVVAVPGPSGVSSPLYIGVGGDHRLYVRSTDATWQDLMPGMAVGCFDNPAAAIVPGAPSILTVVCQGGDRSLYAWQTSVSAAALPAISTPPQPLGGTVLAGPAVAVVAGTMTVLAEGTDHVLYTRTTSPSSSYTPMQAACVGHPAAASAATGAVAYAACQGLDGALYYSTFSGGTWAPFRSAGGLLIDGPGVAPTSTGVDVYVEGMDQSLYHTNVNLAGTSSSGFVPDGGIIRHGAGASGISTG